VKGNDPAAGSPRAVRAAGREELRKACRAAGVYLDLTVGEAMARGAAAQPTDSIVFAAAEGDTDHATLADMHTAARRLAGQLRRAGVRPAEIVVVQGPCDRLGTQLLQALWMIGAVVVPLTTAASPAEVGKMLRDCTATVYVSPPEWRGVDFTERALDCSAEWGLARVVSVAPEAPPGAVALLSLDPEPGRPAARPSPADVCCILYTSGSTAAPKGVQHSHETLLAGLTLAGRPATRSLMTFPSGHMASLLGLLRPLIVGGTTVVMDRWSARHAVELIEEFRIADSAGTPFFLGTLLDEAERSGRDISSLRTFLTGAASVPPALMERAAQSGIVAWRTYGSTEHPAISSGVRDDPMEKRTYTDGRVSPGNEVRLVDEHSRDVPPGAEGEILARGPKQFLGYRDASLDDDSFAGTWFRTGDLGRLDEDGYLTVTDRIKDIIIRGGENISAREVEDTLALHPAVAEVAVCAAPDETFGERVCAFVRPSGGSRPTLEELVEHAVSSGLVVQKAPAELRLVDDFPRTSTGKIRKQDLRTAFRKPS
jgi:cyclohexanecarboxylate-CoA ligase